MPRPNKGREVYAEKHLARHIAQLRQAKGMSYDGLAARMNAVGCPIDQSAIYKIEKGNPRRRITVDELIGFSRAFDVGVEELVTDPALARTQILAPLINEWRSLTFERAEIWRTTDERLRQLREQMRDVARDAPDEARQFVAEYFRGNLSNPPADDLESAAANDLAAFLLDDPIGERPGE